MNKEKHEIAVKVIATLITRGNEMAVKEQFGNDGFCHALNYSESDGAKLLALMLFDTEEGDRICEEAEDLAEEWSKKFCFNEVVEARIRLQRELAKQLKRKNNSKGDSSSLSDE